MLVTYGHRRVRSCRFEQLKASKALLMSITKLLSEKVIISLPRLVFDLQNDLVSRLEAQIFVLKKIYLKRELC